MIDAVSFGQAGQTIERRDAQVTDRDRSVEEHLHLERVTVAPVPLRDVLVRYHRPVVELLPAHRSVTDTQIVKQRRDPRHLEVDRQCLVVIRVTGRKRDVPLSQT